MALDALGGSSFLPKKPKYPEDAMAMMPGEKSFTFKQYDDEAARAETDAIHQKHVSDPESFLPPKHKPTKRELVKHAQTQHTYTADEVSRIRLEYLTKIDGLKRGADKMRRDTIALIKDSTRRVIKEGCQHVVESLKEECLGLLA
jgi:hypothetical protein